MEAERVGEAIVDVEQHARVDRVLNGIIADAGGAERGEVGRTHVGGREREFLEEAERRPQLRIERSRAPVCQHRRDQLVIPLFLLQGQRRDRAVSARSEHTLVQAGRERGEQLPLAHAPR